MTSHRPSSALLAPSLIALLLTALLPVSAWAQRMQSMGRYQAHYNVVPTTLLDPGIVAHYGINRGRDRALFTLSILDADGTPVQAQVTARVKDLLGNERPLVLHQVVEGDAVYYLSEIKFDDRDVLRFAVDVQTPDGTTHRLAFQQTLYWSDR